MWQKDLLGLWEKIGLCPDCYYQDLKDDKRNKIMLTEKSQGLTLLESARIGAPLSPTELILLENALTIAEQRIAELESAQQWHDASEPPEINVPDEKKKYHLSRMVEVQTSSGEIYSDRYDYANNKWTFISGIVRWRELPPLPGKE